jgi:hypothetical protein
VIGAYEGRTPMAGLLWTIAAACLVLSADFAWICYRQWRTRHLAIKRGRTLTQKFVLPRD